MKKSEFKNIVSEKIKIALSSNKKPIKEVFEIHDWFDNKIDQAHDWYRKKKGYDNLRNDVVEVKETIFWLIKQVKTSIAKQDEFPLVKFTEDDGRKLLDGLNSVWKELD